MKKKIKDGSLYFRQRDIFRPLGGGLIIAGLVLMYFGWTYFSYIIACIITPGGLVMFFVGGARHISDNDFAEQLSHAMQDYDKPVTEMPSFDRVVLKQPAPVETAAYSFGPEAAYFKRGKNGTPISDRFTGAHFFFTKDTLLVIGRSLSIAELCEDPNIGVRDFSETYLLAGIREARLEEHTAEIKMTNTGKTGTLKWHELVLIAETPEGEELLRIPVKNDMDAAALCEDITRRAVACRTAV